MNAPARLNAHPGAEPHPAHLFFLADGGMVFGLSTGRRGPGGPEDLLRELRSFAGSHVGYWTHERPPAANTDDFRRLACVA